MTMILAGAVLHAAREHIESPDAEIHQEFPVL